MILQRVCPHCDAKIVSDERRPFGNSTCVGGHVFPMSAVKSLKTLTQDEIIFVNSLNEASRKAGHGSEWEWDGNMREYTLTEFMAQMAPNGVRFICVGPLDKV